MKNETSLTTKPINLAKNGRGGGGGGAFNGYKNAIEHDIDDDRSVVSSGSSIEAYTDSDNATDNKRRSSNGSSDEVIAKNETKAVCHLRVMVIFILLACAVAISIVIYNLTRTSETDAFEIQFEGAAGKVMKAFEDIVRVKLGAIASLTVAMTTHGIEQNETWPFVTLSSFQRRAAVTRSLSGAVFLGISHYVTEEERPEWERYTAEDPGHYIAESFEYMKEVNITFYAIPEKIYITEATDVLKPNRTVFPIFMSNELGHPVIDNGTGPYLPTWQISPLVRRGLVNLNQLKQSWTGKIATLSMQTGYVVMGDFFVVPPGKIGGPSGYTNHVANLLAIAYGNPDYYYKGDPLTSLYLPVFNNFKSDRKAVASLSASIYWADYFENVLPPTDNGIVFVLQSCTSSYTYEINGVKVEYLGMGDLHDPTYNYLQRSTDFNGISTLTDSTKGGLKINHDFCPINITVYPSKTYYDDRTSNTPLIVTISVAMTMLFAVFMFLLYDRLVERRQAIVVDKANQTSAIVSSLFPKSVRDRLLVADSEQGSGTFMSGKFRLKSFLNNSDDDEGLQPIADLFPETTVLFADIAGFTAWSSTREPAQVFTLLQTLYQGFDAIANKRKVFKVETIGDSYVAVTGLPDPQPNHALIMARFAQDCLTRTYEMLQKLELKLGPDTTELAIRFGMHSGPVTAGVLRGERARFQLFGDTVNTAARMESTGHRNKIHISETTANLLIAAGKSNWLTHREDKVSAKGKGLMNTFWLRRNTNRRTSATSLASEGSMSEDIVASVESRKERLVDWVCELIAEPLKVIAMRKKNAKKGNSELFYKRTEGQTFIDEVAEVITLPDFDAKSARNSNNMGNTQLKDEVRTQLRMYVEATASMYQDNPFHNFEHACHVTMSVSKILKRIVTPDLDIDQFKGQQSLASQVHDYTYGINSDPLALLAIIFSAMIHDVDHKGVSNAQLMKEKPEMALTYSNKSVAEQNSLDLAWNLLMEDAFDELRACMFQTRDEMMRFRQVLINVVLATDIFDKELNELRKARWQRAFYDSSIAKHQVNALKATIVIEHIIQASDVSHTMQHWHVYQKWNKRLFLEMHRAYKDGRMGADPASFWYQGEIGFFDNYVIPLAKKLKECGVFGVSSDEFLNYANQNRAEWAERGQEIVAGIVAELANSDSF